MRPELESAWLYAIAANVCRSRRRSFFRRRRVESDEDLHALEEVIAAPSTLDPDALSGLGDALAAMPVSQRNAILLREWHGLSYAEVAHELGISNAAVETLIFRARRSLAKALETEQSRPRRLVGGLNVGSLLTGLKGLLGGAGAAKLAAAGAAVVVASVAAPAVDHSLRAPKGGDPAPPATAIRPAPAPQLSGASGPAPVDGTHARPVLRPQTATPAQSGLVLQF